MNHAGEIEPLTRLVRPQVAIVTTIEPVHLEFFGSLDAIADAKAEIFLGLEPGGARGHQPRQSAIRAAGAARASAPGSGASCRSASTPRPMRGCIKCSLQADCSTVQARILGADVTYKLGAPGRHVVLNSLAVLAAAALVGADLALAALALAELQPATGRGARVTLDLPGGAALLIDESYNANPASMRAALALARAGRGGAARPAHRGARRHAGAGRRAAPTCIAGWPSRCVAHGVDLVFCCGPLMRALWEALPSEPPGRLCRNLGRARTAGACRHPAGRRHHGQGIARLPDGAHRQGARKAAIPPRRAGRGARIRP